MSKRHILYISLLVIAMMGTMFGFYCGGDDDNGTTEPQPTTTSTTGGTTTTTLPPQIGTATVGTPVTADPANPVYSGPAFVLAGTIYEPDLISTTQDRLSLIDFNAHFEKSTTRAKASGLTGHYTWNAQMHVDAGTLADLGSSPSSFYLTATDTKGGITPDLLVSQNLVIRNYWSTDYVFALIGGDTYATVSAATTGAPDIISSMYFGNGYGAEALDYCYLTVPAQVSALGGVNNSYAFTIVGSYSSTEGNRLKKVVYDCYVPNQALTSTLNISQVYATMPTNYGPFNVVCVDSTSATGVPGVYILANYYPTGTTYASYSSIIKLPANYIYGSSYDCGTAASFSEAESISDMALNTAMTKIIYVTESGLIKELDLATMNTPIAYSMPGGTTFTVGTSEIPGRISRSYNSNGNPEIIVSLWGSKLNKFYRINETAGTSSLVTLPSAKVDPIFQDKVLSADAAYYGTYNTIIMPAGSQFNVGRDVFISGIMNLDTSFNYLPSTWVMWDAASQFASSIFHTNPAEWTNVSGTTSSSQKTVYTTEVMNIAYSDAIVFATIATGASLTNSSRVFFEILFSDASLTKAMVAPKTIMDKKIANAMRYAERKAVVPKAKIRNTRLIK